MFFLNFIIDYTVSEFQYTNKVFLFWCHLVLFLTLPEVSIWYQKGESYMDINIQ